MPSVSHAKVWEIETQTTVMYNSLLKRTGEAGETRAHPGGYYYGIYFKRWEYPNGERVSTLHMSDGRYVIIGKKIPALTRPRQRPPSNHVVGTSREPEPTVWTWDSNIGDVFQPVLIDTSARGREAPGGGTTVNTEDELPPMLHPESPAVSSSATGTAEGTAAAEVAVKGAPHQGLKRALKRRLKAQTSGVRRMKITQPPRYSPVSPDGDTLTIALDDDDDDGLQLMGSHVFGEQ